MTLLIITNNVTVSSQQIWGVFLLNVFFYTVAFLSRWTWMHGPLSVAVATGVYIGGSVAVNHLPQVAFTPACVVYVAFWASTTVAFLRFHIQTGTSRHRRPKNDFASAVQRQMVRAGVIAVVCAVVYFAARAMKGLVVTFPFAGVLTAAELNDEARDFAREFQFTSVALLAYFATMFVGQSYDLPRQTVIFSGWLGFGATIGVALSLRHIARRHVARRRLSRSGLALE
jgi:hypothetical protein